MGNKGKKLNFFLKGRRQYRVFFGPDPQRYHCAEEQEQSGQLFLVSSIINPNPHGYGI
jgi:hypothetical protein